MMSSRVIRRVQRSALPLSANSRFGQDFGLTHNRAESAGARQATWAEPNMAKSNFSLNIQFYGNLPFQRLKRIKFAKFRDDNIFI